MTKLVGGMQYILWLEKIGKSRTTGWRWRQIGRVECFLVDNEWFISAEEITRFWQRAEAGEFAGKFAGVCGGPDQEEGSSEEGSSHAEKPLRARNGKNGEEA